MEYNQDMALSQTFENHNYASLNRRFIAFILDILILTIPSVIVGSVIPVIGGVALWFFYGPILESSEIRATLGKHLMGIQVADLSGRRITLKAALIRNAMKIVSFGLLLIGFVFALFTTRKQALHDLLADTTVVYGRSEMPVSDAWVENTKAVFKSASDASEAFIPKATTPVDDSIASQLERLHALREKGALNDAEFEEAKRKILG